MLAQKTYPTVARPAAESIITGCKSARTLRRHDCRHFHRGREDSSGHRRKVGRGPWPAACEVVRGVWGRRVPSPLGDSALAHPSKFHGPQCKVTAEYTELGEIFTCTDFQHVYSNCRAGVQHQPVRGSPASDMWVKVTCPRVEGAFFRLSCFSWLFLEGRRVESPPHFLAMATVTH